MSALAYIVGPRGGIGSYMYVELTASQVPDGWTNDLEHPKVKYNFKGVPEDKAYLCRVKYLHVRVILIGITPSRDIYMFEGGDGKYYWWNYRSGRVARIEERSLEEDPCSSGRRSMVVKPILHYSDTVVIFYVVG